MSRDRNNLFYTRIEDLLKAELGIPKELLHETLNPFFDQIAISVWSLGDVFVQAKRMGWPMSFEAGLEILSAVENRDNPGENGITWDALFEAIEAWGGDMDWAQITEEAKLESFEGDFILFCQLEDAPNIQSFHQSVSLLDAIRHAEQLATHSHTKTPIQIYCIDAEKAEKDEDITLKGNLIWALQPKIESVASG